MTTTSTAHHPIDISVLIVSFNTREVLRECLQSVMRESSLLRTQIIVVDNNSGDGSQRMVEQEFPEALLIRSAVNLGFGGANNLGFQSARGRYLVLLNSDAFLTGGSLLRSVQHMDETPCCGLGGGRLVGRDGSWQPSARKFPSLLDDLIVRSGLAARYPQSRFFGRFDRTWANVMEPAEVDWVPGAYSIIRSSVLGVTDLFDPRFFLYYEEVDLCKRIKQQGYSVCYWPDVCVTHIGGESSRQVSSLEMSRAGSQLTLWRMRSTFLYYRKHYGLFKASAAMILERAWYWQRFLRMRLSRDPNRRASAASEKRLASILYQAWRETRGGKLSPVQPW
jgi:GT2 family glycosyltransferase